MNEKGIRFALHFFPIAMNCVNSPDMHIQYTTVRKHRFTPISGVWSGIALKGPSGNALRRYDIKANVKNVT
ncbi:hypothetical protein [Paraburkholderia sp. J67]|uniref:hypothetical protein n=1 Tax=Paraburkholderia sp. J67 TaxID=2805435 RepID=UPI002ABDA99B|nr:hypothetical protein [Paraburkholderia sp. J67]